MGTRTQHIQIRVTPEQKEALRQLAARADQDMSSYVLARSLPAGGVRFEELVRSLANERDRTFALAALNDFLSELGPLELADAVRHAEMTGLSPFTQNYVAAMVEHACARNRADPPTWARDIPPLREPYFAGGLRSLRSHLLRVSPVAFRRRNLFVDSTIGARV